MERRNFSPPQDRRVDPSRWWDNSWTLAVAYAAYALSSLRGQHTLWMLVSSDRLIHGLAINTLFVTTLLLPVAAAYAAPVTTDRIAASLYARTVRCARWTPRLVVALAIAIPAVIAYAVLERFLNSGDEFAYFFQADLFAHGRLWAHAPILGYTFVPFRTWILGDKWLSQYPPGWPLAMAAASIARIPAWSLNALLGGACIAAVSSRLWTSKEGTAARFVIVFGMLTPFYLLNAGSFFSHMLSALLIVLLCLVCLWYERSRRALALVAGGALLGLLGVTRYFSLILVVPALGVWWWQNRRAGGRIIVIMALAALPFFALLLAYQGSITGHPFGNTYDLIATDDTHLSIRPPDVADGVWLTGYRLLEMGAWTTPLLIPTYLFCLWSKLKDRSLAFYDLVFPTFVLGYVFFADLGGNRYGPRYYFDAFPLVLVTLLSAPQAASRARQLFKSPIASQVAAVSALYLMVALPYAMRAFHRQVESRQEPYRLAAARGLDNAIVIVESPSGRGLDAHDLARNGEQLGPVLYARPGTAVGDLRRIFPRRSIWVYRRNDPEKPGSLVPVCASPHYRRSKPAAAP